MSVPLLKNGIIFKNRAWGVLEPQGCVHCTFCYCNSHWKHIDTAGKHKHDTTV